MIKRRTIIQILLCAGFFAAADAVCGAELSLDLTKPDSVIAAGGIIAPETQFSADGMSCVRQDGKYIDYCSFPSAASFINGNEGSVELMIKPLWSGKSAERINCVFNAGSGVMWGEKNTFHLQRENNDLRFIIIDGKGEIRAVNAPNFVSRFSGGNFHHIAAAWNSEKGLDIYVDGVKEGSSACKFEIGKTSGKISVGCNNIHKGGEKYYYPADAVIKSLKISDKAAVELKTAGSEPIRTVLYPADHGRGGRTVLAHKLPTHLLFFYYGSQQNISKAELQLDLPEKIKIASVCQVHINNIFPKRPAVSSEKISRGGIPYIRYHIEIDRLDKLSDSLASAYNHAVYLEPDADAPCGSREIFWQVSCDGKNGKENRLIADTLPPIAFSKAPEDFQVSLFFSGSLTNPAGGGHLMYYPGDDSSAGEKIRGDLRQMGVNFGRRPEKGSGAFTPAHADWLCYGKWGYSSVVGHPRKGADGKDLDGYACPSYIGKEGFNFSKPLIEKLKAEYGSQNIKFVMPDYELERPKIQCFCNDCVKAFAKFASLDPAGLTPEKILKDYNEKWGEFVCAQNAAILGRVAEIIRAASEDVKIYLCANYVFDRKYMLSAGHDVRLFDDKVDAHIAHDILQRPGFLSKNRGHLLRLEKTGDPASLRE